MQQQPSTQSHKVQHLLYIAIATIGCLGYGVMLLIVSLLDWLLNSFIPGWWGSMMNPTKLANWFRLFKTLVGCLNIKVFVNWVGKIRTLMQHPCRKTFYFGIATLVVVPGLAFLFF